MSPVEGVTLIAVAAIALYAIFGGADFGGGVWDLLASGERRDAQRRAIGKAMGPVWETNHVWLIFIIVLQFTCFPGVFADLSVGLYVPLTFVTLGIVLRGAAFAFRAHAYEAARVSQTWGVVFGVASLMTPLCFGAAAGALAEGSFHFLSPFALVIGVLAVAACAQLAAVFLTLESADRAVQDDFRTRALRASYFIAVVGTIGLYIAYRTAPRVFATLSHPQAAGFVGGAMLLGLGVIAALFARRYHLARALVIAETIAVLAGWFGAQAPYLIPGRVTLYNAAASDAALIGFLWMMLIGSIFLVPSLWLLFSVFKGQNPSLSAKEEN